MIFIHEICFNHKNQIDKKKHIDNVGMAYVELKMGPSFNESHKNTKKNEDVAADQTKLKLFKSKTGKVMVKPSLNT
ncbi:hypothetical protein CRI69_22455 [Escherichia sp. E4742]|nr:hypothetical protein CRI69_22455 [Escherichia sp. E4742]